jgi:hypothetical protein
MFARNISIHLKSNMLSDYTRAFENDVLPLLRKQKGFKGRNHIVQSRQSRCGCDQSLGEQSQCRSLQHQHLPRSVEDLRKNDRWNTQSFDL